MCNNVRLKEGWDIYAPGFCTGTVQGLHRAQDKHIIKPNNTLQLGENIAGAFVGTWGDTTSLMAGADAGVHMAPWTKKYSFICQRGKILDLSWRWWVSKS